MSDQSGRVPSPDGTGYCAACNLWTLDFAECPRCGGVVTDEAKGRVLSKASCKPGCIMPPHNGPCVTQEQVGAGRVCSCGKDGKRGPLHLHECPVFLAWSYRKSGRTPSPEKPPSPLLGEKLSTDANSRYEARDDLTDALRILINRVHLDFDGIRELTAAERELLRDIAAWWAGR